MAAREGLEPPVLSRLLNREVPYRSAHLAKKVERMRVLETLSHAWKARYSPAGTRSVVPNC